jgi:hypothetical protein
MSIKVFLFRRVVYENLRILTMMNNRSWNKIKRLQEKILTADPKKAGTIAAKIAALSAKKPRG